ncbi:proto-oncogene FRAT1 [Sturnira hondurensis]|uniref:proto-oncogene FRAT1 n=1 Tax=Sturnira hondurensis TaxID=192404 RepID=UPI00187AC976|nr:proto-oncogene FRAT1 [Sturnira hondurensis]
MPARREEEEEAGEEAEAEEEEEEDSFLPLEQSVPPSGSGDVDRLVAQMGEMLKLNAAQDSPATPCVSPGPPLPPPAAAVWADGAGPPVLPLHLPPAPAEAMGRSPPGAVRCALGDRGRVRGRAAPYFVAELASGPSALSPLPPQSSLDGPPGDDKRRAPKQLSGPCRRGWLRGAAAARRLPHRRRGPRTDVHGIDDDPHRILQQLVLSGTLIKEAVRRLQSRELQPHENVPQGPFPTPPTAAPQSAPSPSPQAICSDPGVNGESAPLGTGD